MSQEAINVYNEGYYYYTAGNGYPLNYNMAFKRFSEAAAMGVPAAMNYLGVMYLEGKAVPQDYAKARGWFVRASSGEQCDPHALYNLGRMNYYGWGAEKNVADAQKWFELAIATCKNYESPYGHCFYMLGLIYSEVYKDYEKAFAHFVQATNKGKVPEAYYSVGYLFEFHGITPANVSKDKAAVERDKRARAYYEEAAKYGIPEAMDGLARVNLKYHQNDVALHWLRKAAALGYEPSIKRLKLLEAKDSGSLLEMGRSLWNFFSGD